MTAIPFIALMIICLFFFVKKNNTIFPKLESLIILFPALINMIILFFHIMVTVRYAIDYVPYIILFSCILWFYFYSHLKGAIRLVFSFISTIFVVVSIIFGIALGTENYFNNLLALNPVLYEKIESFFMPVINLYLGI